jgi:SAM-dependent methyltransferase
MKYGLLDLLCCPSCRSGLSLAVAAESGGEVEEGRLQCRGCGVSYPVTASVPRFVPPENYADNFGLQWNHFRRTQLDSYSGLSVSRDRFRFTTGCQDARWPGKRILDVGCGAGRFAEVALATGAEVVAVDYSSAADACWRNLAPNPRLNVLQADIYKLPFKLGSFDLVYCMGVLQHTPDVKQSFFRLVEQLRDGGRLAVDVYPKLFWNLLWPKYWIRPITKRMPRPALLSLVQAMVKYLLPISMMLSRVPKIGRRLRYLIPVSNHAPDFPLSPEQVREWGLLDTHDMLSPAFDQPQRQATLSAWFSEAGLEDVRVFRKGFLVGQGTKPASGKGCCARVA